ncbi:hypothetical protein BC832DRAFT_485853 [Gaertneriomyces semiglobifer]|nr:hypothetical protein BC832DRAFT_485853 [Gaertneriomyces semiglobifer]
MSSSDVCHQLLERHAALYKEAVTHPFLSAVANGTADKAFERWLTQDFHFLLTYIQFLSNVVARVPRDADPAAREELIKGMLVAIQSMCREALFFRDQAESLGIDLDYGAEVVSPITQQYQRFLSQIASEAAWAEVLVVTWAVERVYLDSWSFAAERVALRRPNKYQIFISNWANKDFAKFVQWLEDIANAAASEVSPEIERLFKEVVQLEIGFWNAAVGQETSEMTSVGCEQAPR